MAGLTKTQEKTNHGGGVGFVEFFSRAHWMGVVAGLDAEGPVLGGVAVSPGSSPARRRSSANSFLSFVISCLSDFCYLLSSEFFVGCLVQ